MQTPTRAGDIGTRNATARLGAHRHNVIKVVKSYLDQMHSIHLFVLSLVQLVQWTNYNQIRWSCSYTCKQAGGEIPRRSTTRDKIVDKEADRQTDKVLRQQTLVRVNEIDERQRVCVCEQQLEHWLGGEVALEVGTHTHTHGAMSLEGRMLPRALPSTRTRTCITSTARYMPIIFDISIRHHHHHHHCCHWRTT